MTGDRVFRCIGTATDGLDSEPVFLTVSVVSPEAIDNGNDNDNGAANTNDNGAANANDNGNDNAPANANTNDNGSDTSNSNGRVPSRPGG